MHNLVEVEYSQTGQSTSTNLMGMRAMQARAFESRASQYLLIKAPPASGKSRALMFIGLDKINSQGLKKVVVAVPERSIGSSFSPTELTNFGFHWDWNPEGHHNLCTPGNDDGKGKVTAFKNFIQGEGQILICTHATLRSAYQELQDTDFDDVVIAIDEFHHVSSNSENVLGDVMKSIMDNSTAHIVAMTGSYFRGDSVPVLLPEDEAKFNKVTFNYYEQLNGYEFLKSLGIGYHFYRGVYLDAIGEVLDTDKKTIVHIPNVNAAEAAAIPKYDQVDRIIHVIGEFIAKDPVTGVITIERRSDGKIIKLADLVEDDDKERAKIQKYLADIESVDEMDIIIALGMAKEGFDWSFCEHALTVGYRSSLTEIIQIIGRATRDSSNKSHAQFTNLIAQPDAEDDQVKYAVNNMLKAIAASLLMEQVLAPSFKFKTKDDHDREPAKPGEMKVGGFKEPSSQRTRDIVDQDLADLKAAILQDDKVIAASAAKADPDLVNKVLIPKIIQVKYPDLSPDEVEEIRQHLVVDSVIGTAEIKQEGDKKFIRMADKFINIEDLHVDLIDSVNPFQKAFQILSKDVNTDMLKLIQESIEATRIEMTEEEAMMQWPKVEEFVRTKGKEPDINSMDFNERRLAQALIFIRSAVRERQG